MNEPLIECNSLVKRYAGKNTVIEAVSDVNLQVYPNECLLIKGRSGAGKSTLLSLMCGLTNPTSGKVFFEGQCISEMGSMALSRMLGKQVGIIFQSFNLLPTYTIYENVELALPLARRRSGNVREFMMHQFEQFGLAGITNRFPSELSIGQQQKVAIVRTLVKEPSLIFADEPTGSVDEETAGEIAGHLRNLISGKHATLIIATHGNFPGGLASRVIHMDNGKLVN